MVAEPVSSDPGVDSVAVKSHDPRHGTSIAGEVQRLSLGHYILNLRGLGGYLSAASALTGYIAWGPVPATPTIVWLVLMVALSLFHWSVLRRYRIVDGVLQPKAPGHWLLFTSVQLPAVCFGTAIALFSLSLTELDFSLMALIQVSLCTVAMVDMAAIRRNFLWFAVAVLGPGIIVQAAIGLHTGAGRLSIPALILAGSGVVLGLVNNRLYRSIQANLLLVVEQRNLLMRLENANRSLYEDREVLATESRTDALTGLANRRLLEESLGGEWNRCRRADLPLSCVLLDIDYFKAYNDHFGHDGGDECLKQVAAILADQIRRAGDLVARYGGEEFMVLLPNTDLDGGCKVAEQLHSAVLQAQISHPVSSAATVVSISLGVASLVPAGGIQPEQLFKAADLALYEAKRQGRNRVVRANQETMDSAHLAVQGLIG